MFRKSHYFVFAAMLLVAVYLFASGNNENKHLIRVMTYNIHYGIGSDGKLDLGRIAEVIKQSNADVVIFQEITNNKAKSNFENQPKKLGEWLNMSYCYAPAYLSGDPNNPEQFGNAVLSRYPIKDFKIHKLTTPPDREPRVCLETHIDVNGVAYSVLATHLDHQINNVRLKQAEDILKIVEQNPGRTILGGDLNCTAVDEPHSVFPEEFSEPVTLLSGKMKDSAKICSAPFCDTYGEKKIRIDFIFVSPDLADKVKSYNVVKNPLTEAASDHYPVVIEMEVR